MNEHDHYLAWHSVPLNFAAVALVAALALGGPPGSQAEERAPDGDEEPAAAETQEEPESQPAEEQAEPELSPTALLPPRELSPEEVKALEQMLLIPLPVGCGAVTRPCCPGGECSNGLLCDMRGICVFPNPFACGGGGQPCCPFPQQACLAGLECNANGICRRPCGGAGESCCRAGAACDPGLDCNPSNVCRRPCGGAGETCCRQDDMPCDPGLACNPNNLCRRCGGPGDICCPEGSCDMGLGCFEGRCEVCGGFLQPCCRPGDVASCLDPRLVCDPESGRCIGCGTPGQPCCLGLVCNVGTCVGTMCQ